MSTTITADFVVRNKQEPDEQLLSEAKSGDQQAFAELCLRYRGMLMRRILKIVRHREDAEDVLQETFLSVYQHMDSFRGACKFSTWMAKIGINRSLMFLRKRRSALETSAEVIMDNGQILETREFRDPGPDPEESFIADQMVNVLRSAMRRLPPHARRLMDLYYRKEIRLKDAAAILGITEASAKSRMLRGRNRLCRSLAGLTTAEGRSSRLAHSTRVKR